MNTTEEMIRVLTAHQNGKTIQCDFGDGGWDDCHSPGWNFAHYSFRVKPEENKYKNELWHKEIYIGLLQLDHVCIKDLYELFKARMILDAENDKSGG